MYLALMHIFQYAFFMKEYGRGKAAFGIKNLKTIIFKWRYFNVSI